MFNTSANRLYHALQFDTGIVQDIALRFGLKPTVEPYYKYV